MPFPITGIILYLDNALPFFFRNDINTYKRGVVAMTLSLSFAAPGTLLVLLVFYVNLALIGGLLSRHVSGGRISGFSFSRVFFLLFYRLVPSEIPGIYFAST